MHCGYATLVAKILILGIKGTLTLVKTQKRAWEQFFSFLNIVEEKVFGMELAILIVYLHSETIGSINIFFPIYSNGHNFLMQGQVIVKLENIPLRNSRARSGKSSWRTSSRQNCESTHKITYFLK